MDIDSYITRRLLQHFWFATSVLVVTLVASACGAASPTETADVPDAAEASTASVTEDSSPPATNDVLVLCRGRQLPLSALDELVSMDSRPEIVEAVSSFLESEEGEYWPQQGWQIVTVSDTEVFTVVLQSEAQVRQELEARNIDVLFDDGFGDGVDDTINMALQGVELREGTWEWDGSSQGEDCELETPVADGLNRVEWEFDPDAPAPGPESTTIHVLATERECVSGVSMGDRFNDPTVVESDSSVLISMTATSPEGDVFTCPGNPSRPVSIELASPLGDREIQDGSTTLGRISDYIGDAFDLASLDE